jgi:hypothetical protein
MIKRDIDNKYFKQPVQGHDPITQGHFTIDWAFVVGGWRHNGIEGEKDILSAVGQITIDGNNTNPLYDALVKTPLLIQNHPLSVDFKDGMRFIKITNIGKWLTTELPEIILTNVEFEFLDNLNYLESITDFKDQNLL